MGTILPAGLARAYRDPSLAPSETPALVTAETWRDPGLLTIGGKGYAYRRYPGGPLCTAVVRLFTDNGFTGDSYDVVFPVAGPATCTCADFTYRDKEATGETCRHIRAVVALGLDGKGGA